MISRFLYREILSGLGEFQSYLTSLGMQSLGRLAEIISNIEEIDMASSKGRAAALTLQSQATETRFRELVWSLVEGAEWVEIFRGLQDYDRTVIKRLIRLAIIGPLIQHSRTTPRTSAETRHLSCGSGRDSISWVIP